MKFAIMATGWIAEKMAETVTPLPNVEKYAVASRSLEKAEAFAKQWGFAKAYGSYEELVQDPEVELIYVATPHSHHYECGKLCLENGKPALVEKAFCVNAKQARELIALSKEKGVFLCEAFWTRFIPARKMVDELLQKDVIGEITSMLAQFGAALEYRDRMFKPELAGGALLDLGVYTINFARMFAGCEVTDITAAAVLSPEGVDRVNSVTLTFENGCLALLNSNMSANTHNRGVIYGKKGRIEVNTTNNFDSIKVYDNSGALIQDLEIPEQITGYEYEVLACMKAISEGKLECEEMPHSETIRMMEIMDEARAQWGMKYPGEE